MKSLAVPVLTLGLLTCIGALFVQHHHYADLLMRQERVLSAAQDEIVALRQSQTVTRQADAKRDQTRAALAQARSLAARYASNDTPAKATPRAYTRVSR